MLKPQSNSKSFVDSVLDSALQLPFLLSSFIVGFLVLTLALYGLRAEVFSPVRFVSGVYVLLYVPGRILLPKESAFSRLFGAELILGLAWNIVAIQLLLMIDVFLGMTVDLTAWLLAVNAVFVTVGLGIRTRHRSSETIAAVFAFLKTTAALRTSLVLFTGSFLLHIVFVLVNSGSIAPDATFYCDYARNMLAGTFQSNVLNDRAVVDLSGQTEILSHQAAPFVFALAMVLTSTNGLSFSLMFALVGSTLAPISYGFVRMHKDESRAAMVAAIVAVHPTLVYFTSICYGPEGITLVLLLVSCVLVSEGRTPVKTGALGILAGVIESLWFPNFFILLVVVPFFLLACHELSLKETLALIQLGLTTIVSWCCLSSLLSTILSLILFAALLGFFRKVLRGSIDRFLVFYLGLFATITVFSIPFWISPASYPALSISYRFQTPVLVAMIAVLAFFVFLLAVEVIRPLTGLKLQRRWKEACCSLSALAICSWAAVLVPPWLYKPGVPTDALLAQTVFPSMSYMSTYTAYSLLHISPAVLVILVAGIRQGGLERYNGYLLLAAFLTSSGTLLATWRYEDLIPPHFFTTSRFFLTTILFTALASSLSFKSTSRPPFPGSRWNFRRRTGIISAAVAVVLVTASFVPMYIVAADSLGYINPVTRYGWQGLAEVVNNLSSPQDVFLVDRAREFTWLTGRSSILMELSGSGIGSAKACLELLTLGTRFNASYFVMDAYTLARWMTLDSLYEGPILLASPLLLNPFQLLSLDGMTEIGSAPVLRYASSTLPDAGGNHARLYRFDSSGFRSVMMSDFTETGWDAMGGALHNESGHMVLTVDPMASEATLSRGPGFALDIAIGGGFLLCRVGNQSVLSFAVEVWDSEGRFYRYAERIGAGQYFCPITGITVGNVRIVITGSGGDYVVVEDVALWNSTLAE